MKVKAGNTTRDGLFSIEVVACIGACGLAPVISINGEFYAKVSVTSLSNIIETYKPDYIIDDNRNRLYSYSPDMQEWTLNLFINSWNSFGLKKYVQIKPKGIIEKLTTRQIEELAVTNFNMSYPHRIVEDYESAIKWIKEGDN